MKILELRAENIKNIKVVEIKPGDGAVMLTGKNEAGKSAVLDAIFMGLTGKRIDEPIRNPDTGASFTRRISSAVSKPLSLISILSPW